MEMTTIKFILWIFTLQAGWFPGPTFPSAEMCGRLSYEWVYIIKPYGEGADYLCLPSDTTPYGIMDKV